MNTFDPQAYEISIRRVLEDGKVLFKGTVKELPDVAVFEKSQKAAYDAVVCIIDELRKQALEQHRAFPSPSEIAEEYSGRVTLRMSRTLHRQATQVADRERVSLNQLITTVVSNYVGAILGHSTAISYETPTGLEAEGMVPSVKWVMHGRQMSIPAFTSEEPLQDLERYGVYLVRPVRTLGLMSLVESTHSRGLRITNIPDMQMSH